MPKTLTLTVADDVVAIQPISRSESPYIDVEDAAAEYGTTVRNLRYILEKGLVGHQLKSGHWVITKTEWKHFVTNVRPPSRITALSDVPLTGRRERKPI